MGKACVTDKITVNFGACLQSLTLLLLFSTHLKYSKIRFTSLETYLRRFSVLLNCKGIQEVYKNAFDFCRIVCKTLSCYTILFGRQWSHEKDPKSDFSTLPHIPRRALWLQILDLSMITHCLYYFFFLKYFSAPMSFTYPSWLHDTVEKILRKSNSLIIYCTC